MSSVSSASSANAAYYASQKNLFSKLDTDENGTHGGVTRIVLKGGEDPGKPKIQVKAKGTNVAPPALPFTQPVTVQLRNSDGICWEAVYAAPATLAEVIDQSVGRALDLFDLSWRPVKRWGRDLGPIASAEEP